MSNMKIFVLAALVGAAISVEYTTDKCQVSPAKKLGRSGAFELLGRGSPMNPLTFCSTVIPNKVSASAEYTVGARIYNADSSKGGSGTGHVGIAFNYQDSDNYDFIFVRFRSGYNPTFARGFVKAGVGKMIRDARMSIKVEGETWYNMTVTVANGQATSIISGVRLDRWTPEFTPAAGMMGGLVIANGFENKAMFADLQLYSSAVEYTTDKCKVSPAERDVSGSLILRGLGSEAMLPLTMCTTVVPYKVSASAEYTVGARIYNADSSRGGSVIGHVGIAFNYQDSDNYDYIFVRFSKKTFVRGFVKAGVGKFIRDARMSIKLEGETWYNMTVTLANGQATSIVSGATVDTWTPEFTPAAGMMGGVFVVNGFDNDAMFEDLQLSPFAAGGVCSVDNIALEDRVDCGYAGISSSECDARGCCYDDSIGAVKHCYY